MRVLPLLMLVACAAPTGADKPAGEESNSAAAAISYTGDAYSSCAACHLADGVGIPAAFPPVRNRALAIADLEGGRDYLITVVSFGLMGTIEVGGTEYFGIMPGNKGLMTEEALASALNYIVFELTDDAEFGSSPKAFTAEEIASVQSAVATASPATAQVLRDELIKRHGDLWPR